MSCDKNQTCCQNSCCSEANKWYYWVPVVLTVLFVFFTCFFFYRWKQRRIFTRVTALSRTFSGPRASVCMTDRMAPFGPPPPVYSISGTNPRPMPGYPYPPVGFQPPYFCQPIVDQENCLPPPSYEELFGASQTTIPSNNNQSVIPETTHTS